jgi:hypothetical protein
VLTLMLGLQMIDQTEFDQGQRLDDPPRPHP